jgi:hypothetical protein
MIDRSPLALRKIGLGTGHCGTFVGTFLRGFSPARRLVSAFLRLPCKTPG